MFVGIGVKEGNKRAGIRRKQEGGKRDGWQLPPNAEDRRTV